MKSNRGKVLILIFVFGILYAIVYYRFYGLISLVRNLSVYHLKSTLKSDKEWTWPRPCKYWNIKREVQIKTVRDERLNEFLMAEANISDSIEYVDKLDKMFGNSLKDVNINPPVERIFRK